MNRLRNLLVLTAFSLLILGLPSVASAQWRNDDDYYGRNRNGGNGGYGNRNMRSVVNRLKDNSRDFSNRLDRELDNSRYDGRNREDRINQIAKDFRNAADRLEDRFDDGNNRNNSGYNEAQQVLRLGNQLENALRRSRLSGGLQNQWSVIRQDLNAVSNYYGYNNNNRGRGNNRNGNWRNNIPFPLPF